MRFLVHKDLESSGLTSGQWESVHFAHVSDTAFVKAPGQELYQVYQKQSNRSQISAKEREREKSLAQSPSCQALISEKV